MVEGGGVELIDTFWMGCATGLCAPLACEIYQLEEVLLIIDISTISNIGFNQLYKYRKINKETKTFSILLYKINYIINIKSSQIQDIEIKEIKKILLREYYKLIEVFLKKRLDKLLSYRSRVNYNIILKAKV